MSVEGLLVLLCGVGAYAASAAIEVELPNGGRLSPAAAFGPAFVAVGITTTTIVPRPGLLLCAVAAQCVIVAVAQRKPIAAIAHTVGLVVAFGFIWTYWRLVGNGNGTVAVLAVVVALGSFIYVVVNLGFDTRRFRAPIRRRALTENVRVALPAMVILGSTAVLIVLVFPRLSWATFLILFVPMLAARHEFARFGLARRTYDETVRTLAGLAEGAGFVPSGHLERVSTLCAQIGRELAMPVDRLHKLELIGLLHDVGAVAFPDPADAAVADPAEVAMNTGRLLNETEYLSEYASVVVDVARGVDDLPIEGRILRVANAFDTLVGPVEWKLTALRESFPRDSELVAALERVVTR